MKQVKALAIVVAALGFGFAAQAGNNPLIDKALLENIAEKQNMSDFYRSELKASADTNLNKKYRAVEVLEMGDELGGFAGAGDLKKEEVSKEAASKVEDQLDDIETK
jgi:hypothetical protein